MSVLETARPSVRNLPEKVPGASDSRLDASLRRVAKLDFTRIKNKLMAKQGWSETLCDEVEMRYREFLALRTLYPEKRLVPSLSIDEFWHRHILDTQAYQDDCEFLYGRFLHHKPSMGTPEERQEMVTGFAETVELFLTHFRSDPRVTPEDGDAVAWCGCHRCGCG